MTHKLHSEHFLYLAFGFLLLSQIFVGNLTYGEEGEVPPILPMDLKTCYELAVLKNETLGLRKEDILAAQARYWQAVAAFIPRAEINATDTIQNNPISSTTKQDDRQNVAFTVRQPLFNGFREIANWQARDADIKASEQTYRRQYQTLFLDVADVFYQILSLEKELKSLNDIRDLQIKRLSEMDHRVKIGKSRPSEVISVKSDVATTNTNLEATKGTLEASRELMSFLIGVSPGKIELKDSQPVPTVEKLESYLEKTGERPDILADVWRERSAQKTVTATKADHLPSVSAEANYFLYQNPESQQDWNVVLTMTVPLFEGGLTQARVRERESFARTSTLNLEFLRRTAERDVRVAYDQFIATAAQHIWAQEALQLAKENYDLQSKDYTDGLANNLDVTDALRRVEEARRRLNETEIDLRLNMVRLHVAAGIVEPMKAKE
jgi:outer membrane protein